MTEPVAISSFRFVKLSDLVIDHKYWKNPREFSGLDDPDIAALAKDIKDRGIQDALKVQKIRAAHGHVTNLVLDGQRRVLAATEVLDKDADIPVVDRTPDAIEMTHEMADELMLDMLSVVTYREGLSSFELSAVAERLRSRDRTLAEIGRAIRRDESWVSKMLKARSTATPQLLMRWRKGQITDEQFKELAAVKEPEKQAEAVKEVVKTRETGDLTEARVRTKELAESFKKEQKKKESNGTATNGHSATSPPVVAGPQEELFAAKPDKPAPKKMTSRIALQELIDMADKRPPTADYVKGLIDGARYAIGDIGPEEFGKAWKQYLARIDGSGTKKRKAKGKTKKRAAKKAKTKSKRR